MFFGRCLVIRDAGLPRPGRARPTGTDGAAIVPRVRVTISSLGRFVSWPVQATSSSLHRAVLMTYSVAVESFKQAGIARR